MARKKKKDERFTVTVTKRTILPEPQPMGETEETSFIDQEKVFEQTVEKLDLKAVINAVNNPPKRS
jgi:hypothetical protein